MFDMFVFVNKTRAIRWPINIAKYITPIESPPGNDDYNLPIGGFDVRTKEVNVGT